MPPSEADAVVIGSGVSGLTTAALLAKNGCKVLLIEKDKKPGGALRRFNRSGIPFDIGFHYTGGLGQNEILRTIWEYINIWEGISAIPLHPDGYDLFRFNNSDTEVRAYYSYESLTDELCRIFPGDAAGIKDYLEITRNICGNNPFYNPDIPFAPFLRDFFNSGEQSLADTVSSLVKNPELQAVLCAPACLHGVPPDKVGISMHASVAHGYYSGAWGIAGGGQAIADLMIDRLERLGSTIMTGCPVESITVADGKVTGVTAGGRDIRADRVVFTGHPAGFPDLVPDGTFRPAYSSRLSELEDTVSMFIAFGKLEDPSSVPMLDRANMYILDPGLDQLSTGCDQNSMLITAPGRRDRHAAGNDPATKGVILMEPAAMDDVVEFDNGFKSRKDGYQQWKDETARRMVDRAVTVFGEEYGNIRVLATGSPLTFRDELGSPSGGVYGVQHNMHQFVARARTRVEGLYLSGQGTLMTGVLGASLAGLVTAGEIMGLEETWNKVWNIQ